LVSGPSLAIALRSITPDKGEVIFEVLIGSLIATMVFLAVYAFRLAFPNRKIWLDPGQVVTRPSFALRAGFGASMAVYSASFVLAASFYFDPFPHAKGPDFFPVLTGGATAGVVLGILVYLFAGVLYLPVRSDEKPRARESLMGAGFTPCIILIQNIGSDLGKHPFWVAVGMGVWTWATIFGCMGFGWFAYTHIVPEAPNPFVRRRKTSLNPSNYRP
jgi:hypothetical protein